jgi:hypothetical protein
MLHYDYTFKTLFLEAVPQKSTRLPEESMARKRGLKNKNKQTKHLALEGYEICCN